MTDHSKLKQLAEGCRDEVIRSHGWAGMIEDADLLSRDEQFLKECSPEMVLALIAENERLRADLDGEMAQARDFNLEHEELKHERDQLKAERDNLREDRDGLLEAGAHLL